MTIILIHVLKLKISSVIFDLHKLNKKQKVPGIVKVKIMIIASMRQYKTKNSTFSVLLILLISIKIFLNILYNNKLSLILI